MKTASLFLLTLLFLGGCSIMGTKAPEPVWHSVAIDGDIEIRDYEPMIVAEVTTSGERYTAINAGFRILAGYIFGANTTQSKIAMTAPVTQESAGENGQKLVMTAPVTEAASEKPNEWKIRFVMPSDSSLASLPEPNDKSIIFLEMPMHRAAVIKFSGLNTNENLSRHLQKLAGWLEKNKMQALGQPSFAFYNPPWTLPFLRRNEIMIKISR